MTKTFKILTAISFIALVLALTFVGVWALTDLDFAVGGDITYTAPVAPSVDAEDVSYLTFTYDDTTLTASVIGFDNSIAEVSIPARILYNSNIYSVRSIGYRAFRKKSAPTSITIPEGVTSIGDSAFEECASLTSIKIPNSVTNIGMYAFSDCKNLTYNTYDNAKYLGNDKNPYVVLTSVASKSITSCAINSGCRAILAKVFSSCTALISLIIPDNVKVIQQEAFYGCTNLTSVTIGSGITSIEYAAFDSCKNLAEVNVKATTPPTGGRDILYNCSSSLVIYVPTGSESAYKSATNWSEYTIQGKNF